MNIKVSFIISGEEATETMRKLNFRTTEELTAYLKGFCMSQHPQYASSLQFEILEEAVQRNCDNCGHKWFEDCGTCIVSNNPRDANYNYPSNWIPKESEADK